LKLRKHKLFKAFNKPHIEVRLKSSTPLNASEYCKKEGKFHEHGIVPSRKSGIANTWTDIKDKIIDGLTLKELNIQYPEIAIRYNKGLGIMFTLLRPSLITYNLHNDIEQKHTVLFKYQIDLLNYIDNKQSERGILWIYDPIGNSGKTSLRNHLTDNYNFITLFNGKTVDIAYQWNGENVIFDFSRSQQKYINYEIIENIENGRVKSTKYIPVIKKYLHPHVIIMSNFKPDTSKLSLDRWCIYEIDDYKILIDITQETIDNNDEYNL